MMQVQVFNFSWLFLTAFMLLLHKYDTVMLLLCRSLTGIREMIREVFIAITTTIESREWMQRQVICEGVPVQHSRAGTTDDVAFFSVMQSMVGNHFTCKRVWCLNGKRYVMRMDRDLPFHYYTSTNEWYHEGERPSFHKFAKPTKRPTHQLESSLDLATGSAYFNSRWCQINWSWISQSANRTTSSSRIKCSVHSYACLPHSSIKHVLH